MRDPITGVFADVTAVACISDDCVGVNLVGVNLVGVTLVGVTLDRVGAGLGDVVVIVVGAVAVVNAFIEAKVVDVVTGGRLVVQV